MVVAALVSVQLALSLVRQDPDLTELTLEELMSVDVEVTSVAKKPQRKSETPAAVFVLTAEDIRRSGATTIPEALRLVPGLSVARISSNTWAISSRGFNGQFANKLLVLIDGRSVYTPLFSGVYWDVQDVLLADVERIEVVRGPGATLFGANAVNGVIDIITRNSKETQGGLVRATGGTEEKALVGMRYGVTLAEDAWMRVWGKWSDHEGLHETLPGVEEDDWQQARAGFRADWEITESDALLLEGEAYRGGFDGAVASTAVVPPARVMRPADGFVSGEHLLGRLDRELATDSSCSLQLFLDSYRREIADLNQRVDTVDLEWQHRFPFADRHELMWGLGYRRFAAEVDGTADVVLMDDDRTDDLWSAFLQDEITLLPELKLTIGSKFELNDFTGFEYQPSARFLWTPVERHGIWGAVSRAVRTPSIVEDDAIVQFDVLPTVPFPTVVQLVGSDDVDSEKLTAYELGWRWQPAKSLSLDVAAFYQRYDDLQSLEPGTPSFSGGVVFAPQLFGNGLRGRTLGVEAATQWNVAPTWTLHAGYAFLDLDATQDSDSLDTTSEAAQEKSVANQQAQLRSLWNVTDAVEFDVTAYYVDSVPQFDVDAYVRVDARLGWRATPRTDLSLVVQGLFHHEEREFGSTFLVHETQPQAGVYIQLTQRF